LPALKSFYEKFFSLPNLDIAHIITNITDYLDKLSKVSSIQISIPQQSQDDFFYQNFISNIAQDLGCASDTKIDLKITPTNIKDLNKFKETIKDYDAKYYNLKINGQNESGYLYNYKRSCFKEIISINTDETDDIIFESLITNLEKWMQNNND
jgi:hypothetical protein